MAVVLLLLTALPPATVFPAAQLLAAVINNAGARDSGSCLGGSGKRQQLALWFQRQRWQRWRVQRLRDHRGSNLSLDSLRSCALPGGTRRASGFCITRLGCLTWPAG